MINKELIINDYEIKTIKKFLKNVLKSNNDSGIYFSILVKLKNKNSEKYRTISKIYIYVNEFDINELATYIYNDILFNNLKRDELYEDLIIENYIIRYSYFDKYLLNNNYDTYLYKFSYLANYSEIQRFNNKKFNICKNTNITKWLNTKVIEENKNYIKDNNYKIINNYFDLDINNVLYNKAIFQFNDLKYNITQYFKGNKSIILFNDNPSYILEDTLLSNNEFIRKIGDKVIYYKNNNEKLIKKLYKNKKLKKLNTVTIYEKNNLYVLDIETLNINNELYPYCICFYDGINYIVKYGKDCLNNFIKENILKEKYNNSVIYVHNLSKFDYIYLLNEISNLDVNILPDDTNLGLIKLSIKYKYLTKNNIEKTGIIHIHDSQLMLPYSLDKLSYNFNLDFHKSEFPFKFMDSWDKINYIGEKPSKLYYNKLPENYNDIKIWNAKEETIKYIKNDCNLLYSIINIFNKRIQTKHGLNINNYPTLSSLSLGIFRTHFYENETIDYINGILKDKFKSAYYGGEVNVYKPIGKNLYSYDINSLYPYCMKFDMPTQLIAYEKGEINLDEFFGFLNVKIIAPDNLKIPFLPVHYNKYMICPLGKWNGIYFSEEIKYAIKLGYKIEIIDGYSFKRGKPFNNFVDYYYNEKSNANFIDKYIAKLILNSLYGRMGLSDKNNKLMFLNNEELINKVINNNELYLIKNQFPNDKGYYKFKNTQSEMKSFSNVPIAAAITAYARMEMYKYKNIPGNECYYSDTDSVFLQYPLDDKYISNNNLGFMKFEYKAKEALFIAPKNYYILKDNNTEITKIKGYNDKLTKNDYLNLLNKNNIQKKDYIMFKKNIKDLIIKINKTYYTININNNKRENIYDENGILIDTKPQIIKL